MFKNKGIALKLILFISLMSIFVFMILFGINYDFSRKMIEKNVENNAHNLIQRTVNRIESILRSVQKIPENMAYFLENTTFEKKRLMHLIKMIVENNDEIYGSTIAFEPHAFEQKSYYFSPYYYKKDGQIVETWLGSIQYNIFHQDWYQIPKELNRSIWTEPYFDEGGGNILMSTYSVPFYKNGDKKKYLLGIVTADISLEWLTDLISAIKVLDTGYAFLISKNGTIITHPDKSLIMNETIFGIAETHDNTLLRDVGRRMIRSESGFVEYTSVLTGKECWMYYAPIPSTGWTLAVLFPQDEFMADIRELSLIVGLLGIFGLLLLILTITFISRKITKPLRAMARAAGSIGSGNLDVDLPAVESSDEVGRLTEAFRYMKKSLKDYIKKLTETTAAKERIESELKIATEIQTSMLPQKFPPFPDRKEFDIFASMEPAREIGGDFYDFFLIGEDRLCLVIGDVSGKGIPAALFMVISKTLLKTEAQQRTASPDEILSRVNNIIFPDNETLMFVTFFCVILNIKTGEIEYSNAGHNPPFIYTETNDFEYLDIPKGMVLGVMPNAAFSSKKMTLRPGDRLFLYTDGVTEAMNQENELFSDKRLKLCLTNLKDKSIQDVAYGIREEIKIFAQGAAQSDDITMLVLEYRGNIQLKEVE